MHAAGAWGNITARPGEGGRQHAEKGRLGRPFPSGLRRFPLAPMGLPGGKRRKETLLRKASESIAHVSEAGRPLEAGSLSRASAGCLLQIEDLGKAPGIRNTLGGVCGPLQTTRRLVRAGGPAAVGAGWNMPRFLRQMDARNARAASVRRKDGPCHSERRVGMGPARKRAATKRIPRTAWTAPSRRGTCAATQYRAQHGPRPQGAGHAKQLFSAKRLTRRKDGAIIPPINAEGGRAGMKAARMDYSSVYSFTFGFTFMRKALLRCAV